MNTISDTLGNLLFSFFALNHVSITLCSSLTGYSLGVLCSFSLGISLVIILGISVFYWSFLLQTPLLPLYAFFCFNGIYSSSCLKKMQARYIACLHVGSCWLLPILLFLFSHSYRYFSWAHSYLPRFEDHIFQCLEQLCEVSMSKFWSKSIEC